MNAIADATLTLSRRYSAPIEKVFDAWTQPDFVARWFGPSDFSVLAVDIDFNVGGDYKIAMRSPDGQDCIHFGRYVHIKHPTELVFTWILEDQACGGCEDKQADTLVTISLSSVDGETELQLCHERLPDQKALDGHEYGWQQSLLSLEALLNT